MVYATAPTSTSSAPAPALAATVLVPSYQRPDELRRCLQALCELDTRPNQVVIVAREHDVPTQEVARAFASQLPVEVVLVRRAGLAQALNAGFDAVRGDVVATTDDDARPHKDWLTRILAHYAANPRVGGVGGRDRVHERGLPPPEGTRQLVGRVQWFGRIVGNHDLGTGGPRAVDILKGVNMSYRRDALGALRVDERLRGTGAQTSNELSLCLPLRERGWTLIYDPRILVEHYPAARAHDDQRDSYNREVTTNAAYNLLWLTQLHLRGWPRLATRVWLTVVGTPDTPGIVNFLRLALRRAPNCRARYAASRAGRAAAIDALRALSS